MGFIKLVWLYIGTGLTFLVVDMVWLGYLARNLYRQNLGPLLAESVNRPAAVSFYLIFIVGIIVFAVLPALNSGSFAKAVLLGSLFGLVAYSAYDLTNLATLKNWPLGLSIIDIAWGTFLSGVVASAGYQIGRWLGI